jgi:FkbM family methyltransferase
MENLALNGLVEQVSPIRAALGATTGTTKIHMFKNLSPSHASVSPLTRHDYELLEVPLIRVDEYLQSEGISNVHLLKCDVEGAELDVLIGCGDLLRSEVAPLILIELNTDTSAAMGFTKTDIWSYLNSVGYDIFFACEARGRVRQIRSVKEFMRLDLALCAKRTGLGERLDRTMLLGA